MTIVNKFRAKKTIIDGINFASRAEAARYVQLNLLQKAGEIRGLILQQKFLLTPRRLRDDLTWERASHYIADFSYIDKNNKIIVEDVKGFLTKDYILKRKMMLHIHNIAITEIKNDC